MRNFLPIYSILLILFSACATTPKTATVAKAEEERVPPQTKELLSPSEQDAKALEAFKRILTLTEEASREAILPQIEIAYLEIIREYPDSSIAQESYWRLVLIYVDESIPPRYDEAERLYNEFIKKYPESQMRSMIEDTLSKNYYNNGEWDRLLRLYIPPVKEYIKTGKLDRPHSLFMYSEAKFNLGDLIEAEKGYKIVIALFPNSAEAVTSKSRLEEIKKKRER
jgi:tetratricopeptide (TPR) repeat protein